ncbi:hypothetical protein [Streptomyces tsukubensis]|uniref:hypothetical protein n=1 Tax=Streptomyces tsukubensis TaxID=83656 RepID=UPI00344C6CB1
MTAASETPQEPGGKAPATPPAPGSTATTAAPGGELRLPPAPEPCPAPPPPRAAEPDAGPGSRPYRT